MCNLPEFTQHVLIAAGQRCILTAHVQEKMAEHCITIDQVKSVLEDWQMRGIDTFQESGPVRVYWRYDAEHERLLKVAASLDGSRIITAIPDSTATMNWRKGRTSYFTRRYTDWEIRNES